MSVQTQIERISNNVQSAFNALKEKGVTVPSGATSDDLSGLIGQTAAQTDVDNLEKSTLISTHLTAIAAGDGALPIDVVGNLVKVQSGGAVLDAFVKVSDRIPTLSDLQRGYAVGLSIPNEGTPISAFEPIGTGEYNYSLDADAFNASVDAASTPGLILFGIGACDAIGTGMPGGFIVQEGGAELDGATLSGGVYLLVYASAFRISGFDWSENGAVYADTLTWDGDTTGRAVVSASTAAELVHVSDQTPTQAECANGGSLLLTTPTEVQTSQFTSDSLQPDGDIMFAAEGVVIVYSDNVVVGGLTLPKKGIYFARITETNSDGTTGISYVSSLTLNGYKFMVSKGASMVTKYVEELIWDGDTDGLESVSLDTLAFHRVSASTPTEANFANGCALKWHMADGTLVTRELEKPSMVDESTGIIVLVGEIYEAFIVPADNLTLEALGVTFPKAGTYFLGVGGVGGAHVYSLKIPGFTFPIEVDESSPVLSVNGIYPDENGDVQIKTGLPTTVQVSDIAAFAAEKASDGTFANPEGLYTNLNNGQYVRFTIQDDSTGGRAVMWFTSQAAETLGSLEIWLISEPGATPSLWLRISNDDGCEFAGAHFLVALTQIMSDAEKATFKSNLGIA